MCSDCEYKIIDVKGTPVKVSISDYDNLIGYGWYINERGYVARNKICGEKHTTSLMHREINNTEFGFETDHVNRDVFDNRRCNLRTVTHAQNMCNKKLYKNNISGFVGVSLLKRNKCWQSGIRYKNRTIYLGSYKDPCNAAIAYNKKSIELNGEFARLNTEIPYGWMLIEC